MGLEDLSGFDRENVPFFAYVPQGEKLVEFCLL